MDRLGGGYRAETTPRCSASELPAIGDLVVGSLAAVDAGRQVQAQRARAPERREWNEAISLAVWATVLYASTIYGWRQVQRCDDARDAHDRWLDQHGHRSRGVAAAAGGNHAG